MEDAESLELVANYHMQCTEQDVSQRLESKAVFMHYANQSSAANVNEYNHAMINSLCPLRLPPNANVNPQTHYLDAGGVSNGIIFSTQFPSLGEDVALKFTLNIAIPEKQPITDRIIKKHLEGVHSMFTPDTVDFPNILTDVQRRHILLEENEVFVHFNVWRRIVERFHSPCVIAPIVMYHCTFGTIEHEVNLTDSFSEDGKEAWNNWVDNYLVNRYHDTSRPRDEVRQLFQDVNIRVFAMEQASTTLFKKASSGHRHTPRRLLEIIFMILYTLACAQRYLPGFRSNDMHAKNIFLLHHDTHTNMRFQLPGRNGEERDFFVNGSRLLPVIADFGYASFHGSKNVTASQGVSSAKDYFYDVNVFLTSMHDQILSQEQYRDDEFRDGLSYSKIRNFVRDTIVRHESRGLRFDVHDAESRPDRVREYTKKAENEHFVLDLLGDKIFEKLTGEDFCQGWSYDDVNEQVFDLP